MARIPRLARTSQKTGQSHRRQQSLKTKENSFELREIKTGDSTTSGDESAAEAASSKSTRMRASKNKSHDSIRCQAKGRTQARMQRNPAKSCTSNRRSQRPTVSCVSLLVLICACSNTLKRPWFEFTSCNAPSIM